MYMKKSLFCLNPLAVIVGLLPFSVFAHEVVSPPDTVILPEVTVSATKKTLAKGALRPEVIATESISAQAIAKSGASNINEAVDKNPGIAVQLECSICNVRNVSLNNLPGRYTTLLIDGIPIYSSVSSAYGLDSLSVNGIERVDIARGAGASLIAPEALSGMLNLVSKKPNKDEASLRLQAGGFSAWQAELYAAKKLNGGAFTITASGNQHGTVDANGDGLSEYTGYQRKMLGFGYFIDDMAGFKWRGRLDVVDEKRNGGAVGDDYAAIKNSNNGNPFDFSQGVHASPAANGWLVPDGSGTDTLANGASGIAYQAGRGGLAEIIFTKRTQWIGSAERKTDSEKWRFALGIATHKQDSFYEFSDYVAKQRQYFAEASYQVYLKNWNITAGLNYRYEDLASHGYSAANGLAVHGVDNYVYRTPAIYLQANGHLLDDTLEVNASLRYDRHNQFGGITSPRLNLLYRHNDAWSSRLSLGTGFRAPTSFFEQDHGILDDVQIVRVVNKVEQSRNLSYTLNYTDDRLNVSPAYHYTRIDNMALLAPNQPNPDGSASTVTLFSSATTPVIVQGLNVNASYQLSPLMNLAFGAELFHYQFEAGTLSFARPTAKAYFGLDYTGEKWDLSSKLVWTGSQNLRKFHDDGSGAQERYNLDGSPKLDKSPAFFTLDMRSEYAFNTHLSAYLGVDNVLDYKQIDHENMLWIDAQGGLDTTHIWGPNRGRFIYAGIQLRF